MFYGLGRVVHVSTPFKRERGSKVSSQKCVLMAAWMSFPFPSNGNADPKTVPRSTLKDVGHVVFQFPSNGNADPKRYFH